MKNMYALINKAVKAGAIKVFVIGYAEGNGFTFTEANTLAEALQIKAQMCAEGHKVGIDVYTR